MTFDGTINLYYASENANSRKNFNFELNEDIDLTTLFGYFIEFTRLIGYQEGSWDNVIAEIYNQTNNSPKTFGVFNWSNAVMYER